MAQDTGLPAGSTRSVDVGGCSLDVWSAGEAGPTVLLVHGIPTNHRLWWDVVPLVCGRARVLAVDMLGYGDSPAPEGRPVDLASQAALLLDLLDALGVDRAVVVGHDLGGGVAQILAATASDRVAGLGVVNGVCYDAWPVPMVRAMNRQRLADDLPGARLTWVDDAGHFVPADRPDVVADAVLRLVDRT